jgi:hypothetical protein
MGRTILSTATLASALTISLASIGCGGDARPSEPGTDAIDADTARLETPRGHEGAPITLTGCLQRASGDFVLTQVNRPSGAAVGTAGASRESGDVAREQMRAAKHSYTLDGDDDQFEPLVGRQVRVVGTLAEISGLRAPGARADAPRKDRRSPVGSLETGDLAKVDVAMVEKLAETCQ